MKRTYLEPERPLARLDPELATRNRADEDEHHHFACPQKLLESGGWWGGRERRESESVRGSERNEMYERWAVRARRWGWGLPTSLTTESYLGDLDVRWPWHDLSDETDVLQHLRFL